MKIPTILTTLALCLSASAQNPDEKYFAYPSYDGDDLELTVDSKGTRWRLWSPAADAARVIIYPTGINTAAIDTIAMTKAEKGTWTASVPQQLYGKYYTFCAPIIGA